MGAVTLINVSVHTIYQDYGFGGKSFLYALWWLWWVDVAISCLCVWGMAQIMYVLLFAGVYLQVPTRSHQDHTTTPLA
jgi:hypothetical protein